MHLYVGLLLIIFSVLIAEKELASTVLQITKVGYTRTQVKFYNVVNMLLTK